MNNITGLDQNTFNHIESNFMQEASDLIEQIQMIWIRSESKNLNYSNNIQESLRIVHNLKGGASHFSFIKTVEFCHYLEDILAQFQDNSYLSSKEIDLFLQSLDNLSVFLNSEYKKKIIQQSKWQQAISLIPPKKDLAILNSQKVKKHLSVATHINSNIKIFEITIYFDPKKPKEHIYGIQIYWITASYSIQIGSEPSLMEIQQELYHPKLTLYVKTKEHSDNLKQIIQDISDVITDIVIQEQPLILLEQLPGHNLALKKEHRSQKTESLNLMNSEHTIFNQPNQHELLRIQRNQIKQLSQMISECIQLNYKLKSIHKDMLGKNTQMSSYVQEMKYHIDHQFRLVNQSQYESSHINYVSKSHPHAKHHSYLLTLANCLKQLKYNLENKTTYSNNIILANKIKHQLCYPLDSLIMKQQILHHRFSHEAEQLDLKTKTIQNQLLHLQLLPLKSIVVPLHRLTRNIATQCNKQIRLELKGENTVMDQPILETLKDILIQLIRNAIVHGIESPNIRKQKGKPTQGCISIKAKQIDSKIHIQIGDDGGGINLKAIQARAIQEGIISNHDVLSNKILIALILDHRISTSHKITTLAGRGIGLNLVQQKLEEIRGDLSIRQNKAQGLQLDIRLPITQSLLSVVFILLGKTIYSIPIDAFIQVILTDNTIIKQINEHLYLQHHSKWIKLFQLENLVFPTQDKDIEFDSTSNKHQNKIFLLNHRGEKLGIYVDELVGASSIELSLLKHTSNTHKSTAILGFTLVNHSQLSPVIHITKLFQNAKLEFVK